MMIEAMAIYRMEVLKFMEREHFKFNAKKGRNIYYCSFLLNVVHVILIVDLIYSPCVCKSAPFFIYLFLWIVSYKRDSKAIKCISAP